MRLLEFDVAKAICIILVVMGHYAVKQPVWWTTVHDIIYTFHMPLFMFASGYIYIAFKKEERYTSFLCKKVKRLLIPYIVTSIIVVTIKLLSQNFLYVENSVTILSYLRLFYLPEAGYYLWFIWALWWMFVIVPLFKSKEHRIFLFFVAILLHYTAWTENFTDIFCIKQTAFMLIWFMLGVISFDWKLLVNLVKPSHLIFALIIFSLAIVVCIVINNSLEGDYFIIRNEYLLEGAKILCPYCGIFFIMIASKYITQIGVPKWLMTIAGSTYIIYLFHTTVMGLAKAILMKIPSLQLWPVVDIIIVVAMGISVPILMQKIFQKYRLTRIMFGLK